MMLAAAATPALATTAAPAAAALRVMHGFADHTTISLWIQGAGAQSLEVEVSAGEPGAAPAAEAGPSSSARATISPPPSRSATSTRARPTAMRSARRRRARSSRAGTSAPQALWQHRGDPPTVRIATGSCAYMNDPASTGPGKPYGGGEEIFDSIAATAPDLMLWLGDNIYLNESDYTSRHGIDRRYRYYRDHPAMRRLWTAAPHVAIWDDHDFGPDNSDSSYSGSAGPPRRSCATGRCPSRRDPTASTDRSSRATSTSSCSTTARTATRSTGPRAPTR
jgi:alkaline phosphatase D